MELAEQQLRYIHNVPQTLTFHNGHLSPDEAKTDWHVILTVLSYASRRRIFRYEPSIASSNFKDRSDFRTYLTIMRF